MTHLVCLGAWDCHEVEADKFFFSSLTCGLNTYKIPEPELFTVDHITSKGEPQYQQSYCAAALQYKETQGGKKKQNIYCTGKQYLFCWNSPRKVSWFNDSFI